jgi:membrane protease YdiL (CAAX protease family)
MKKLFASKWFLLIETIYLIVFPLLFLHFLPGFYKFRILAMIASLIYIGTVIQLQNLQFPQMGFTKHWKKGLSETVVPLTSMGILLIITNIVYPHFFLIQVIADEVKIFPQSFFIPIYMFISVPLQEFIFRGFYIRRLELVSKNKWFLIFYSAFIFMLIHLPFGHVFMIGSSFLLGLYLAYHFVKFRNIYVLFFVHAILGGIFVYQSLLK